MWRPALQRERSEHVPLGAPGRRRKRRPGLRGPRRRVSSFFHHFNPQFLNSIQNGNIEFFPDGDLHAGKIDLVFGHEPDADGQGRLTVRAMAESPWGMP
jgi:hypothetical protein